MSFWTRLFGRDKKEEVRKETEEMPPVSTEEEKPSALLMDYKEINMEDEILRSRYIMNCLEQMADATEQIEELEKEYQTVSAYLEDTEKIDKLPAGEKRVIALQAKAIDNLNVDREKYKDKKTDPYRRGIPQHVPDGGGSAGGDREAEGGGELPGACTSGSAETGR
jgi:hypothetical protein